MFNNDDGPFIMIILINARRCIPSYYYIQKPRARLCNGRGKDDTALYASYRGTAITFLIIGSLQLAYLLFLPLVLNQNHTAMAQQQRQQPNGTFFSDR